MKTDMTEDAPGAEKRLRDAAATREAILASARICFMARGFEQVGVREIAEGAGVTAALINRYFGSKEALFGEVLNTRAGDTPDPDLSLRLLLADRDRFGVRLAERVLSLEGNRAEFDPMVVMLRSLGQPAAEAVLRERLAAWLEPVTRTIGGPDAAIAAELILATLAGFDLFRNVIKSPTLFAAEELRLVKMLGAALQAFLVSAAPREAGADDLRAAPLSS